MGFLSRIRDKIAAALPDRFRSNITVIPVVRLSGAIGAVSPLSPGLSISSVASRLERAFDLEKAPAVAIVVNSPGGSPVQSRLIFERIRALADEKKKKVHVFVEDVAASGGYMIACAGDDIVADPSSIVGSIGVVSAGFGFKGLIDRLGIERRVHTSGENKAVLDPFQPEKPEDVAHLLDLQKEVHETFIDLVRERRGSRLRHGEDLFTGLFWSGKKGLELGLVDALGDLRGALRERYGEKVKLRLVGEQKGMLAKLLPFGRSHADVPALVGGALAAIEERALWSRYGL
jgi:signal peptide peptidase SppA